MAKSYALYLAAKMCRYGSLININPSASFTLVGLSLLERLIRLERNILELKSFAKASFKAQYVPVLF